MNLCGKQVFEFVLQCGVALLIEIDRNGVGCRPQLRGKIAAGGVGLVFVRSFHLPKYFCANVTIMHMRLWLYKHIHNTIAGQVDSNLH